VQTINNVPASDIYTEALTLGPTPTTEKIVYLVANNAAIVQFANASRDKTVQEWGPEILITPTTGEIQRVQGMRFRNAVAGSPTSIVAQLIQPDDVVPVGGTPFTSLLTPQGSISPVGSAVIVARGTRAAVVSTVGTTFATGADVLAGDLAFTADGVSNYMLEVSARGWIANVVGQYVQMEVKLDGADYGSMALKVSEAAPLLAQTLEARAYIAAPASGAHTINARILVSGGGATGQIAAGAGGPLTDLPVLVTLTQM